jgi:CRISPR-associated protein Cas1
MGRPVSDPIDFAQALAGLAEGKTVSAIYRAYAGQAARPYAPSTFHQLVIARRRTAAQGEALAASAHMGSPSPARAALARPEPSLREGDGYWSRLEHVKPANVLTLTSDDVGVRSQGGALVITDGGETRRFEPRGTKPEALVLLGWGGWLSVKALRFCARHHIAVVILDWARDFLTIVSPHSHSAAAVIRLQCAAVPLTIAKAIVRAKIEAHAVVGALPRRDAGFAALKLGSAHSLEAVRLIEARAARDAWARRSVAMAWREAGRIPVSWKIPYTARRRGRRTQGHAKARDPINCLLNLVFSVTVGRLVVELVARGLEPALGYLHQPKPGRLSLAYDAVEPLRAGIEARVFDFIAAYKFAPSDFLVENETGRVKSTGRLTAVVLDACAPRRSELNIIADWLCAVIVSPSAP